MVFPVSQDSTFKDDVTALQGAMSRQGDYIRLNILLNIIQYIFNTLKRFPNLSPVQWSKEKEEGRQEFSHCSICFLDGTFMLANNAHMQKLQIPPQRTLQPSLMTKLEEPRHIMTALSRITSTKKYGNYKLL